MCTVEGIHAVLNKDDSCGYPLHRRKGEGETPEGPFGAIGGFVMKIMSLGRVSWSLVSACLTISPLVCERMG